jgi:acetyl-CoA C-acetyltransferase
VQTLKAQRIAIIGGQRIPFCQANTKYAQSSNHEMMPASLRPLVERGEMDARRHGDDAAVIATVRPASDEG